MTGSELDKVGNQLRRKTAVSHRRQYGALLIDGIAIMLLAYLTDFLVTEGFLNWLKLPGDYVQGDYVLAISAAYFLLAALLYRGASFGMRILGLGVLRGTKPPGLMLNLIRSALGLYIVGLGSGVVIFSGLLRKSWPYDPIFSCRMVREPEQ